MSTPIRISDAALEAMLARRAHRADPGDLRDAAFLRIEAVPVGLGDRVAAALGRRQTAVVPAFAWVLLLAGLLLAMVVASLAAGAWRPDRAVVITPTAPPDVMTTGRLYHTATLLEDGRVLLTGGDLRDMIEVPASAELYDPATGAFVATGSMATKHRIGHTAIRLADGRVLLVGGRPMGHPLWCEIWDPATGRFTTPGARDPGASADGPHVMAAGPLADGRVLVHRLRTSFAELLDPATGSLTATGALVSEPRLATATLLRDGRVLVVGGGPKALVYDPATREFTDTGVVSDPIGPLTAVTLLDGRVLILGDEASDIYDPATGSIVPTGSMTDSRTPFAPMQEFAAVLLADGRVLVTGGDRLGTAELYDPATGTFSLTGSMAVPRYGTRPRCSEMEPCSSLEVAPGRGTTANTVLRPLSCSTPGPARSARSASVEPQRLASIPRTFTAVAAMQLHARGPRVAATGSMAIPVGSPRGALRSGCRPISRQTSLVSRRGTVYALRRGVARGSGSAQGCRLAQVDPKGCRSVPVRGA